MEFMVMSGAVGFVWGLLAGRILEFWLNQREAARNRPSPPQATEGSGENSGPCSHPWQSHDFLRVGEVVKIDRCLKCGADFLAAISEAT